MTQLHIQVEGKPYPILSLPGRAKSLLDRSVSEIYEIPTWRINETVKRNLDRFPEDFYFELSLAEARILAEVEKDLNWKKGHLPKAFTPLGCQMMASVLKSPFAMRKALQIQEAFAGLEKEVEKAPQPNESPESQLSLPWRKALREELEETIHQFKDDSVFFPPQIFSKLRIMEERMKAYEREIQYLRESVQELKNVDSSHLVIPALTEELYRNRSEIQKMQCQIEAIQGHLKQMELPFSSEKGDPQRISKEQAQQIKDMADQVARSRKDKMNLWAEFKKEFGIGRYIHLPQEKFATALQWIEGKKSVTWKVMGS